MAELIYSIKDIFDSSTVDSCLVEYEATNYHIPAYQRGYKWGSDEYGAVSILLQDLENAFNSFKKGEQKEYYLQYITLKKVGAELEVIDGQQRLTTISILLSILAIKLELDNIAVDKLKYAIRADFFKDFIYKPQVLKEVVNIDWDHENGLTIEDGTFNNQDVYYIFHAAKKITEYTDRESLKKELKAFYDFLLNQVKIIVNVVSHVASEKVFSNLNSNKVALTEVELIKALFITKLGRLNLSDKKRQKTFYEIIEKRVALGREWDEISRWANDDEVNTFYFKDKEGLKELLLLVANQFDYKSGQKTEGKTFPLFNFFQQLNKVEEVHGTLRKYFQILNEWYRENGIYNRLGYLLHSRDSDKRLNAFLHERNKTKSAFIHYLDNEIFKMLPDPELDYFYDNGEDSEIHRILLYINVFQEGHVIRFNYHRYNAEKWTLEHIFPQNIDGKNQKILPEHISLIKKFVDQRQVEESRKELSVNDESPTEVEVLLHGLKKVHILNSIGNMCLLTNKDNSSNGCLFFDEKRKNTLSRIRKGSFVPKHTFDVFSKMIFEEPGDLSLWTKENIDSHKEIIKEKLRAVKSDQ